MKKSIYLMMALTLLMATALHAEYIDTPEYQYDQGESIQIEVNDLSSGKQYWLGVYPKSKGNNWRNVVSWPLENVKNGVIDLERINATGTYEARLFRMGTYKLIDTVEFDVGSPSHDCGTPWYKASLTHYSSYPKPGSEECTDYNGCRWSGWFYGLENRKSKAWVKEHRIVSVHMKDWDWLGNRQLRIRQGNREIVATAYDACADSDCDDCCTKNLGDNDFLIDIEKYTMKQFGSGSGDVMFQVCD
ncbi:MAG TPA: hypothetical protein ENJ35_11225 [Gammaproteobacteria bacterium]|nr:hypothetical protein [Gammaproteobacteria bacterium]